jgi:hypothetical protein
MLEDREYNGGFVKFVNNVTTTMLDEQMTKIKVVDLRKLKKFVVDNFFIWIHFANVNYIWISQI